MGVKINKKGALILCKSSAKDAKEYSKPCHQLICLIPVREVDTRGKVKAKEIR